MWGRMIDRRSATIGRPWNLISEWNYISCQCWSNFSWKYSEKHHNNAADISWFRGTNTRVEKQNPRSPTLMFSNFISSTFWTIRVVLGFLFLLFFVINCHQVIHLYAVVLQISGTLTQKAPKIHVFSYIF